jgi:diguanylate cyclase (GGDEF)-like protein
MHAEVLSVVLVSAQPATVDLVRKACSNGNGSVIQFASTSDVAAAPALVRMMESAVVLLDDDGSAVPVVTKLRALAGPNGIAPVMLLAREAAPSHERAMIDAGAAEVLPLAELSHGTLRRALRYALSRHESEQKLARLATFDPVSGLATPILFWEILGLAVRRAQRNRDFFSILLIDFDWSALPTDIAEQAKPVLYKRFGDRIKALMRASDTVARFDKSQVIVLAESMPRLEDVQIVAAKILSDITAPAAYEDRYLNVNAAIGIAIYPTSGGTPEGLIDRASQALGSSKERTSNRFAFA